MFIKKLGSTTVNTKYGEKKKWIITDETEKTYDSFVGKWNSDWKEGGTIEVRPEQIKSREYNGKTYFSIEAPPESKSNNNSGVFDGIKLILDQLQVIKNNQERLFDLLANKSNNGVKNEVRDDGEDDWTQGLEQ